MEEPPLSQLEQPSPPLPSLWLEIRTTFISLFKTISNIIVFSFSSFGALQFF
jgi:hypothetical protein